MFRSFILSLFILCVGCSTLTRYPSVTTEARQAFERGQFNYSKKKYIEMGGIDTDPSSLDAVCYMLESGMAAHMCKDYQVSNKYFTQAEEQMEELRKRAKISLSDMVEKSGQVLLNDKTIPYSGEHYERTLLHTFKAMNYLLIGEDESARVEIKKAEISQNQAEEENIAALQKSKKEIELSVKESQNTSDDENANPANFRGEYIQQIQEKMDQSNTSLAEKYVKDKSSIYQLASTFYLSSLVHEMLGEHNDSYIELKKLYEANPGFSYGVKDLFYCAKQAGFEEDVLKWSALAKNAAPFDPQRGSVVVFFAGGMGPFKQERAIVIPTGAGIQKIAWPNIVAGHEVVENVVLKINGKSYISEVLTDLNSVALRYHRDHLAERIVAMVVRLMAKIVAQHAVKQYWGVLASFVLSLGTSVTEQADERCWMTLPRTIQALRVYLPAGEYDARLVVNKIGGGNYSDDSTKKLQVVPGKITFIVARSINSKVFWTTPSKVSN